MTMSKRKLAVSGVLAAAVAAAGACTDVGPVEPLAFDQGVELFGASADPASFSGGLDAAFARIAEQHPGFGGAFYGEDGTLYIYSTGVQPLSTRALGAPLAEIGVDLNAQPVRVLEGQYDFRELRDWRARADVVFGLRGVVFTDVDEAVNRVRIGVENAAAEAAVARAIAMAGVPREAVVISRAEPEYPMQTLRDRVRPVAGGLQINFPGFLCTLGFNVRSPQYPNVHGFVTNSHCTAVRGEMTETPYWQPSSGVPDSFIGNEAHDEPFFTGGPCPAGSLCRYSDAAGVRYEEGVPNAFGQIYRTTGIGSLTIDQANPFFEIVEERPRTLVGDPINKVGRTTGWSSGSISFACVNIGVAGTNPQQVMLCQDRFSMSPGTQGGDSGSPMFQRVGEDGARLVGILWGTTTFSPMENIRFENEGPAPWITFPGQTPPPPPAGPPGS
jgi:hypothetical protein